MRLLPLHLALGAVLGRTVRNGAGQALLQAGVELTPAYLDALRRYGYGSVFVEDPLLDDVRWEEPIRGETRALAFRAAQSAFAEAREGSVRSVAAAERAVRRLTDEIMREGRAVFALDPQRAAPDYTWTHAVNVCILSLLAGLASGLDSADLHHLGLGSLLHDVGRAADLHLADRAGALSDAEWERVKQHPAAGYQILRSNPQIHLYAAHVAFQHHERVDGSGYPRGIRGERMLQYGRIAAAADALDAMTADRPHRQAKPPHVALGELLAEAGTKFDSDVVRRLARRVGAYPNGTIARLSSGELAAVVDQGLDPWRPTVRVVAGADLRRREPLDVELAHDGQGRRIAVVLPDWPLEFMRRMGRRPARS